jgi:hypothetical protein
VRKILLLLLLAVIFWFWWTSMRARQNAHAQAKRSCTQFGVRLIDDTVERIALKFIRDNRGQLKLARLYRFQFFTDGEQRYNGYITMVGHHVTDVKLDPYAD